MRELELQGSEGKVTVEAIGNASPGAVRATHRLGQLQLDLGGSWQGGSDVDVAVSKFGNVEVIVPEDPPLAVVVTQTGRIGNIELPEGLAEVPGSELAGALRFSALARNGSIEVLR